MTEIACGWRSSETGSVECPSSVPPSKRGILTFHWPAGMRVMRLSRKSTVVPSVSSHVVCMNKLDESCKNDWCVIVSTPSVTYRIPRRTVPYTPVPSPQRPGAASGSAGCGVTQAQSRTARRQSLFSAQSPQPSRLARAGRAGRRRGAGSRLVSNSSPRNRANLIINLHHPHRKRL